MSNSDVSDWESALSLESDEEFGLPNLGRSEGKESNSLMLTNWTAQDFSNIFVEFRPHLERHAKKFVSSQFIAEEIVQESFLYLMTSLPEIDSKEGVLRFLKWKVKMLALDTLRSAHTKREKQLPEGFEAVSDVDISEDLERAEDNAVIRLALSRLSPRQRHALLANVYEEKSAEQIGVELGLSANSARQLVFRARRAFRQALVGEAETQGKAVSEILAIAAKKLASDARASAGKTGVFLVLTAALFGFSQLIPTNFAEQQIAISSLEGERAAIAPQSLAGASAPEEPSAGLQGELGSGATQGNDFLGELGAAQPSADPILSDDDAVSLVGNSNETVAGELNTQLTQVFDEGVDSVLSTVVSNAGIYQGRKPGFFDEDFSHQTFEVFGGTGVSAFIGFDSETNSVYSGLFHIWIGDKRYAAVPGYFEAETNLVSGGYQLLAYAKDFYLVREDGSVFSESPFSEAEANVSISLNGDLEPKHASISFLGPNDSAA